EDNNQNYAELSFAVQPDNRFEVSIGNEILNISPFQEMESLHLDLNKEDSIKKYSPKPLYKKPSVYLHGGIQQEPTLVNAICASLVKLGGTDKYIDKLKPMIEDKYPISIAELEKRRKKHKVKSIKSTIVFILLLPIIIPLNILSIIVRLAIDLFRMPRLIKEIKKYKD
ncbi:MAG: hypothetical protein ACSHWU_11615, partial [Marinicella sp.]